MHETNLLAIPMVTSTFHARDRCPSTFNSRDRCSSSQLRSLLHISKLPSYRQPVTDNIFLMIRATNYTAPLCNHDSSTCTLVQVCILSMVSPQASLRHLIHTTQFNTSHQYISTAAKRHPEQKPTTSFYYKLSSKSTGARKVRDSDELCRQGAGIPLELKYHKLVCTAD